MATALQQLTKGASTRPSHVGPANPIHARTPKRCGVLKQTLACSSRCSNKPRQPVILCRWQRDPWTNSSSNSSRRSSRSSSRSSSSRDDKQYRFRFNQLDFSVAEDQLWRFALPFATLFGLAIFVGPIVVGITISAIAVGAAFSAGALAFTTLLLPLIVLSSVAGLLSFGLFATVGAAFVIPKMIFSVLSLGFLGGGLLLGWAGVNWLLSQTASTGNNQSNNQGNNVTDGLRDSPVDIESKSEDDEKEFKRISSELREFDEILAARTRDKPREEKRQRRIEQWEQWDGKDRRF